MNKPFVSHLLLLSFLGALNASATEIDDLKSILDDATDSVTKKYMNVNYLPSIVTVIDAQTFMDAGAQNVGEAIGMLPGIQMQLNFIGQPIINIRGITNPDSMLSDKIKILVDGVAINNEGSGNSGFYLDFPIGLVQRIEVLRGPGSTEYGAGAFFGAVNVITKLGGQTTENQLFLGAGSYRYRTAATNLNEKSGEWKMFADGYYSQNEKSITNEDRSRDKTTDEAMTNASLGVKFVNGGVEFYTRYKESHYGNFFQYKDDIEPNHDNGRKETYFFSQLSYKTFLNDFSFETKAIFSNRESDIAAYFTTNVDQIAQAFNVVDVDMQEAFHVRDHQVERNIEAQAILTLPKIISNDISIGIGIRRADLSTNDFYSSVEVAIAQNLDTIVSHPNNAYFPFNATNEPAYWDNPTSSDLFSQTTRTISHAYIQDLISLHKDVDLVLGARVDDYSDIGMHISSRAGLVYRASDKLIAKLLYGSAYRAPTFYERYTSGHIYYGHGVDNLLAEETDTYEAALIYIPSVNHKISLNAYYSELRNIIDSDHSNDKYVGYVQMKDRVNKGVEFEYYFKTKETHNLFLNATYTDSEFTYPTANIDQSMPDISNVMIKAMYVYRPITKLSFGTSWKYYSETVENKKIVRDTIQSENVARDTTVEKQYILDETVTYKFSSASEMRLTIKNILDRELRLPSNGYSSPGGELREGRNYFLNYTYLF